MSSSYTIDNYGRTSEDRKRIKEQADALNAEAAANWENPEWRREMGQRVTDAIYYGFEHENLLSLMTDVETVGPNDVITLRETKGLRAFWFANGGYIQASTLQSETAPLPRDWIGFHVYEYEDKLQSNFAETQATLINLGIQRMDAEINRRLLAIFQAAVPDSSDYYVEGAGLSLSALDTAIREVRDESLEGEVVIIGRETMVGQIGDELLNSNSYSAFLPETNEQLFQRGVIGRYRGARVISLKNYKDDQNVSFFPANELWVAARDASKFGFYGGLKSKEFVEQANWYWHYLARRSCGGAVTRPERLRRVVDDSIPA